MFVSRIVAALFALAVLVFVSVATFLKDPADSATRLPAELDIVNIDLATEPFDALAPAYDAFDLAAAGAATRTLMTDQLTHLFINDLDLALSDEETAQIVAQTVASEISDQDIEAFQAILTFATPEGTLGQDGKAAEEMTEDTTEAVTEAAAEDAAADPAPTNALVLTAAEQRVVNFGDVIGARAADLMLAMQLPEGALAIALADQDLPALTSAIRPRLTRVQRVAYLAVPVETYIPLVEVTGSTAANRRTNIRARTGSTVDQIFADRGDYVQAGQVLLTLNEDGREAQRLQASATIAQAEAQFAQAETSLSDAEEAQADLIALGEFASAAQLRNAGSAVDQAFQNLNVARANLAQAEANLVQIDLDIDRLTITAPFSGRIETRTVEAGGAVNPGDSLFALADFETMIVTARVSDSLRQTLSLGDMAEVIVGDSDPAQSFTGPITLIDTTSDAATRTFEVEVELANPIHNGQPTIVDNQFATIIFAQDAEQIVRIPQSALTSASIAANAEGTTGILTVDADDRVAFTEITFADYAQGGELLINADRVGGNDIRLIVGRGGFVKIGDLVNAREKLKSTD